MFSADCWFIAAYPQLIQILPLCNRNKLLRNLLRGIKFSIFLGSYNLFPCPAEDTSQATTDTVCSRDSSIEPGRPEAVIFPAVIFAYNISGKYCHFNRVEHKKLYHAENRERRTDISVTF